MQAHSCTGVARYLPQGCFRRTSSFSAQRLHKEWHKDFAKMRKIALLKLIESTDHKQRVRFKYKVQCCTVQTI